MHLGVIIFVKLRKMSKLEKDNTSYLFRKKFVKKNRSVINIRYLTERLATKHLILYDIYLHLITDLAFNHTETVTAARNR